MDDRQGIFAGDDPFGIARRWLEEAGEYEPSDPNAAALATVDADGLPDVRVVLIKDIEDDGFLFFTNYESAKAGELDSAGKAARRTSAERITNELNYLVLTQIS